MQRNQIRDDQNQEVTFLENYLITILSGVFINILSMENIQEKTKHMIFGVSFDTTEIHSLLVLVS